MTLSSLPPTLMPESEWTDPMISTVLPLQSTDLYASLSLQSPSNA